MFRRIRNELGFTLAELLIVIGIMGILAGVSFIGVARYMRSLAKLEYDGNAKSIFVAAQNHLTMASHEGFLGRTDFGEAESDLIYGEDEKSGIFDFVEDPSGFTALDQDGSDSVLGLLLPFGSVDDTVRSGSYLIRYHRDSAQVLDVFFWSEDGWNGRFSYSYQSTDYADLLEKGRSGSKSALQDYRGSVVGYYGGAEAESLIRGELLNRPELTVINAEKLSVKIKNTNKDNPNAKLRLYIKGNSSGNVRYIDVRGDTVSVLDAEYEVILDDVTTAGKHFFEQFCNSGSQLLIPGEDITVYAVAYNDEEYTNIAYSSEQTTNSLFASIEGDDSDDPSAQFSKVYTRANISNIRHLENLDDAISNVNNINSSTDYTFWISDAGDGTYVRISEAQQKTKLDFDQFKTVLDETYGQDEVHIHNLFSSTVTDANCYLPVSPNYHLIYHGNHNSISNITVSSDGNGGLFGSSSEGIEISDLQLIDFDIHGATASGALAGDLQHSTVTNVLAINSKDGDGNYSAETPNVISSTSSAGGLIGTATDCTISKCASALYVRGDGFAGGLIGNMSGGSLAECYTGGHTHNGVYDEEDINVCASGNSLSFAGGLVGSTDAEVESCYSTCSVSGGNAGGLVGSGRSGATFADSYCTGLVIGQTAGAFASSMSGTADHCLYFGIINPLDMPAVGNDEDKRSATPFDVSTATYRQFIQIDDPAKAMPYDASLIGFYRGVYHLRPVAFLSDDLIEDDDYIKIHYGDWPAPDLFFVNDRAF